MAIPVQEIMARLPPERRVRIAEQANELIADYAVLKENARKRKTRSPEMGKPDKLKKSQQI